MEIRNIEYRAIRSREDAVFEIWKEELEQNNYLTEHAHTRVTFLLVVFAIRRFFLL